MIGRVIGVVLLALFVKRLYDGNAFRSIQPHHSKYTTCTKIYGSDRQAVGFEDITIDQQTGIALISSSHKVEVFHKRRDMHAGIYKFDVKAWMKDGRSSSTTMTLLPLRNFPASKLFHPHGISLYQQNGTFYLYAVNHDLKTVANNKVIRESIEVFEWKEDKLFYLYSLEHPLFWSLNDVVVLSRDRICATNDHYYARGNQLGHLAEEWLELCWSSVVCANVKGGKVSNASIVADGFCYSNGINVSPDGEFVFVAEPLSGHVSIFKRNQTNPESNEVEGKLIRYNTIETGTGVDNIEVIGNDMYIGCHPDLLKFLGHVLFHLPSPSQAIKISFSQQNNNNNNNMLWKNYHIEELFLSNGDDLSASATATTFENILLIGPAIMDDHILVCY